MRLNFCALAFCLPGLAPALADPPVQAPLSLELNRIDPIEGACRLTFVVTNRLATGLDALALETVLIDTGGRVERLSLFDFGALPAGAERVRQFDVPGLDCAALGRVLINGVAGCESGAAGCAPDLDLRSRIAVEVVG